MLAAAAVIVAAVRALGLLRQVPGSDYLLLFEGAAATFLRVNAALLIASLWTIPVGVAIGFNPRLARICSRSFRWSPRFRRPSFIRSSFWDFSGSALGWASARWC